MPYDNKQCKSYNGLKIKYAGLMEDKSDGDGKLTIIDWDNDTQVNSNTSALIDLNQVGSTLNPTGFDSLSETLSAQNVQRYFYNASGEMETTDYNTHLDELTYSDLLYNLSPELTAIKRIDDGNTVFAKAVTAINEIVTTARDVKVYLEVSEGAFPELVDSTISSVLALTKISGTVPESEIISNDLNTLSGEFLSGCLSGDISKPLSSLLLFNDTLTFNDVNGIYAEEIPSGDFKPSTGKTALEALDIPKAVLKNTSDSYKRFANTGLGEFSLITAWTSIADNMRELLEHIYMLAETAGLDLSRYESAKAQLNMLQNYLDLADKYKDIKTEVSGIYGIFQNTDMFKTLLSGDVLNLSGALSGSKEDFHFGTIVDNFKNSAIDAAISSCVLSGVSGTYTFNDVLAASGITTAPFTESMTGSISGYAISGNVFTGIVSSEFTKTFESATAVLSLTGHVVAPVTGTYDGTNVILPETFAIPADQFEVEFISGGQYIEVSGLEITGEGTVGTTSYAVDPTTYPDYISAWTDLSGYLVSCNLTDCANPAIKDNWLAAPCLSARIADKDALSFNDWLNIYAAEIDDSITEAVEPVKGILINGKNPSGLLIPSGVISSYIDAVSGIINIQDTINTAIDTETPSGKTLAAANKILANIYNDPYFKKFDDNLSGQAVVDSHLLTTPEIDFKYGVYLDSKECNISNEQYDDLVTANNFTKRDPLVSKYGEDIDTANFIIIDKHKTIVDGVGSNQGYFVTIIDPFDALKMQRLMVNPCSDISKPELGNNSTLADYGLQSKYNWKVLFKDAINTLDTLQRVKNADGIWVGEKSSDDKKGQLFDTWSVPLTGDYYDESISKSLMNIFPQIPLADVTGDMDDQSTIDKQYSSYIVVAVCKTMVNPSDGKITVTILEQFFGSLFDEKNPQTGEDLFIGNNINSDSKYIEFYRNNYTKPAIDGYAPAPYNRTAVPQFYIKDSAQLNNACKMVGIDQDLYDVDDQFFTYDAKNDKYVRKPNCPVLVEYPFVEYEKVLRANNIFVFNKKNTILYNNHPEAVFSSFSKKEAQKIIANTTGLFGKEAGTTANIGNNFIIDMDRCINFIKNVDDIPIYFVADAGLSTIAQFCDNVIWDPKANDGAGKWVTQNFDPDNDPDIEDRAITSYNSVSTWRKVVDKLDQISREIRRDCMTIIDAPRQLTLDGAAPKIRRSKPQNNWDEIVGEKLRFISGINSSYTAGYYNWLRATDEFSGLAFWMPPTCKIIGNYMYLNIMNLPWLAPAGMAYGTLNGVYAVSHNPSPNEEDQIYMKSWNYIKQYPFDGFIVEGQKTTLTKNSAFNRVNVRTLFLDLERFVYNVSKGFKYTVNNQYTREQFVQSIRTRFEDYMIRGGIYDYMIKCDGTNNTPETIDANELRAAIYIKPARLVEFILIDMVCTKTNANFDEIVL